MEANIGRNMKEFINSGGQPQVLQSGMSLRVVVHYAIDGLLLIPNIGIGSSKGPFRKLSWLCSNVQFDVQVVETCWCG